MNNTVAIVLLIGTFIVLLVMKTPISFSLLTSSIVTALYLKLPLMSVMVQMVKGVHSFSLMAIPFLSLREKSWDREEYRNGLLLLRMSSLGGCVEGWPR